MNRIFKENLLNDFSCRSAVLNLSELYHFHDVPPYLFLTYVPMKYSTDSLFNSTKVVNILHSSRLLSSHQWKCLLVWSSSGPLVSSGRLVRHELWFHQKQGLHPKLLLHLPFSFLRDDDEIAAWVSCWNPWPCLTSCTSASSDQHSGKHDKWSPLLGSALSLECDVLCSCHMGCHVIVVSSSSALCQWPWLLDPSTTCCQLWRCVSGT